MAKSKYAELDKDALVEEIKTRRAAGRSISVDLRAADDKLRGALDADDMENGDFDPNAKALEKVTDKPAAALEAKPASAGLSIAKATAPRQHSANDIRNQVSKTPEAPITPTQPTDEEFAKGTIARHKSDGLLYQVVKHAADEFNKPVKCRMPAQESGHPGYYWEGSEEEFTQQFEKV